jgi:hypothetical protein
VAGWLVRVGGWCGKTGLPVNSSRHRAAAQRRRQPPAVQSSPALLSRLNQTAACEQPTSPAQPSQPTAHLVGQRQPELNLPSQLAGAPLLLQCRLQQAGRDGVLPPLVSQLAACKLDGPQLLLSPQLLRTLRGVQCGATRRGSEGKDAGQQLRQRLPARANSAWQAVLVCCCSFNGVAAAALACTAGMARRMANGQRAAHCPQTRAPLRASF